MSQANLPRLWFGHNLNNPIPIWNYFDGEYGILLNAYQILKKPRVHKRFAENGLKETLGYRGKVFLDSGGFLFQMNGHLSINAERIIDIYKSFDIDVGVVLDYPLNPNLTYSGNYSRWVKTIRNTGIMLRKFDDIVPVIHGLTPLQIKKRAAQIKELFGQPKVICIGSMVPFYRSSYIGNFLRTNGLKKWEMIGNLVNEVRVQFPDSHIHAFGSGSINNIKKLYELGVNSTDSVYWQVKAGFGEIIAESGLTRSINYERKSSKKTKRFSKEDLDYQCNCPICTDRGLEEKILLLKESYKNRAIHNAYTIYELTKNN